MIENSINERETDAMVLNVVILPDKKTASFAIEMSKKIKSKIGSRFTLEWGSLFPHITIYQAYYPKKNIEKLKKAVKQIASQQELFKVNLNSITVNYETFIFWKCKKTRTMQVLHRKMVDLANPLRESLVSPQLASVTGLTAEDRYDVDKFGSLLIGSRYVPHITIARLNKDNDAKKVIDVLGNLKEFSFEAKDLALGCMGADGTVTGIIERFPFSNFR